MSGLRRDKLDRAGRFRSGLLEMCDVEELAWHAACLEADITKLRAQVREAYTEGFDEGACLNGADSPGEGWDQSAAKKSLGGEAGK